MHALPCRGASPLATDSKGRTALHYAAAGNEDGCSTAILTALAEAAPAALKMCGQVRCTPLPGGMHWRAGMAPMLLCVIMTCRFRSL